MRLAFLTSLIPVARPDTGFEIANAAVLEALRAAGHAVTAIGFVRPGEVPADPGNAIVLDEIEIENAAVPARRKLLWLAAAFRYGLPVACAKLRLAGRGRLHEALRRAGPFDALVLNSVTIAGAFPELAERAPAILVEHNIEYVSARQSAAHAASLPLRLLYAREARRLEAVERRLWQRCRFVWTLSQEDRAALGPAHADKSAVLPLGAGTVAPSGPAVPVSCDVGLIGTWTWAPNLVGLDWFLREVVPLLPEDVRVAVAGRVPKDLAVPARVALPGRVPDAAAFLRGCHVVALSSRAGTGVQLKTVEALRLGLPAVATPLSCRGFAAMPENVSVAEAPADFARALVARIRAARAGDAQRLDGAAFVARQQEALERAIASGLAAAA